MVHREIGDFVCFISMNWVATRKRDMAKNRFFEYGPTNTILKIVELGDKYVLVKEVFGRKKYYTSPRYLYTPNDLTPEELVRLKNEHR